MTLELFTELRKTINVHDIAQAIRTAIGAEHDKFETWHKRQGNVCSLVIRVTQSMADKIERYSTLRGLSVSEYIEQCCWQWLASQ
jgi:hypothetical protein